MNAYNSNAEMFYILDPSNQDHIRLLDEFQIENNIDLLSGIKMEDDSNRINKCFFISESSKMRDFCQIEGEKDLKKCKIVMAPIKTKRKRKLIKYATTYVLNALEMEDAYVYIPIDDEILAMNMEQDGYLSLDVQDGSLVFQKEKKDVLSQTGGYENYR